MKCKIDQGTVIYGIKSEKYSSIPCYGVIINARCDIAQDKVPNYYYLVAVDATSWFCSEHGYQQAYSQTVKQKKQTVCSKAKELELDGETLLDISSDYLRIVLEDKKQQLVGKKKELKRIDDLCSCIDQYTQVAQVKSDSEHRSVAIQSNSIPAIQYLKDVDTGKFHHYYFLPQAAYLNNGIKSKGLIIDLLEIGKLSISDAKRITDPFSSGILYSSLPSLPTKKELMHTKSLDKVVDCLTEYVRLRQAFWLENDSDFVGIEGHIESPWCEHLMQRFSNVFVRIGLENPTEEDFRAVITNCCKEE